jgi:hypothetical protein
MRTSPTPLHATTVAVAAVVALLSLFVLPAVGLALEEGGADDAGRAGTAPGCEPLVTFTTTGTSGEARAVAITAQALEQGVEGWSMVAWEVAEGTQVSSLTIVTTDGRTETRTHGIERGSADDVLELRFCGRAAGAETDDGPAGTDDEGTATEAHGTDGTEVSPEDPPPATEESSSEPATDPGEEAGDPPGDDVADTGTSQPGEGTAASSEDPDQEGVDDSRSSPNEPAIQEEASDDPADGTEGAATGGATTTADAGADTEVLGVQLARTGGDVVGLLLWGMLGAVGGAVVLLAARRHGDEGRRS